MKYMQIDTGYLVKLEIGEKVIENLTRFIESRNITGGMLSAIGAIRDIDLGYFHLPTKQYLKKHFPGIYELLSFSGNICYFEDHPFIHAHVVISDSNFRVFGGHLFEATIAVTMELFVFQISQKLLRKRDEIVGLNLLNF